MKHCFTPALYQPPARWYPGGKASVQTRFVPAVNPRDWRPQGRAKGKERKFDGGEPTNWLDPRLEGTPAYYPHALLSYYHWREMRAHFSREAGYLFGDSGGFSVMTLGASIDPRDVLKWQQRVCNAGVILDVPPVNKHGKAERRQWEHGLNSTVMNTARALPLYNQESLFRWWGVVHGWSVFDMEVWWRAVSSVYPFDNAGEGWAFKPRPTITPTTTAWTLKFIADRPAIRRAHFLMTTGAGTVATLLAFGPEAGLDWVSYDSASASAAGINRTVFAPTEDGLGWESKTEKYRASEGKDRRARDYVTEHCACWSCDRLRYDLEHQPDIVNEEYWKFRFIFHNILMQVYTFDRLAKAAANDSRGMLRDVLGKTDAGKVERAFRGQASDLRPRGRPQDLLDWL